jgi:hypothetical protein
MGSLDTSCIRLIQPQASVLGNEHYCPENMHGRRERLKTATSRKTAMTIFFVRN